MLYLFFFILDRQIKREPFRNGIKRSEVFASWNTGIWQRFSSFLKITKINSKVSKGSENINEFTYSLVAWPCKNIVNIFALNYNIWLMAVPSNFLCTWVLESYEKGRILTFSIILSSVHMADVILIFFKQLKLDMFNSSEVILDVWMEKGDSQTFRELLGCFSVLCWTAKLRKAVWTKS